MAVVFDITGFREVYPQFSGITDAQLKHFFKMAELVLDNTDFSIVKDEGERETLLWLLVCHLATLYLRGDVVGNLTSASEGSVSASYAVLDWGNGKWYGQTPCGAAFWEATKKYRVGGYYFAYRPSCGKLPKVK